MRLWIDDLRSPPDDTWVWVKTSAHAIAYLCLGYRLGVLIEEISFDHDLGGADTTMPVAKWVEEYAHSRTIKPPRWHIHSANPVGRKNLQAALESADRYWNAPS